MVIVWENFLDWYDEETDSLLDMYFIAFTFEEFYNLDVVQDLHKKFAPACADKAIKCLYNAYKNHLNAVGIDERKKYALSQIKKIIFKNNVFVVHYKNNDFYNYTIGGDWY